MYTVGQIAKKFKISRSTLLYYDSIDLLKPKGRSDSNYRLYADALVLQAEQWARSSLAAYEVGKVEFNTMINAHIRLLRFELQSDRYLFTIYEKRAELEEILGGPIQHEDARVEVQHVRN